MLHVLALLAGEHWDYLGTEDQVVILIQFSNWLPNTYTDIFNALAATHVTIYVVSFACWDS